MSDLRYCPRCDTGTVVTFPGAGAVPVCGHCGCALTPQAARYSIDHDSGMGRWLVVDHGRSEPGTAFAAGGVVVASFAQREAAVAWVRAKVARPHG